MYKQQKTWNDGLTKNTSRYYNSFSQRNGIQYTSTTKQIIVNYLQECK